MTTSSERDSPPGAASVLRQAFATSAARDRAALVLFTTAGHPSPAATAAVLDMLAEGGADIIELGIPFSDPLADGPVIQRASFEAIAQGADLAWTLETLADFRARHTTPVVLFSYLNPLLRYGLDRFLTDAAAAGADGLLVTDLPAGADPRLESSLARSRLDPIPLVAPTTPTSRMRAIAASARGFVYYISRAGVTGEQAALARGLEEEVGRLRSVCEAPIAVGFGIATPAQAATVARVADGVVVGSALVKTLGSQKIPEAARFVASLRSAMVR